MGQQRTEPDKATDIKPRWPLLSPTSQQPSPWCEEGGESSERGADLRHCFNTKLKSWRESFGLWTRLSPLTSRLPSIVYRLARFVFCILCFARFTFYSPRAKILFFNFLRSFDLSQHDMPRSTGQRMCLPPVCAWYSQSWQNFATSCPTPSGPAHFMLVCNWQ